MAVKAHISYINNTIKDKSYYIQTNFDGLALDPTNPHCPNNLIMHAFYFSLIGAYK